MKVQKQWFVSAVYIKVQPTCLFFVIVQLLSLKTSHKAKSPNWLLQRVYGLQTFLHSLRSGPTKAIKYKLDSTQLNSTQDYCRPKAFQKIWTERLSRYSYRLVFFLNGFLSPLEHTRPSGLITYYVSQKWGVQKTSKKSKKIQK